MKDHSKDNQTDRNLKENDRTEYNWPEENQPDFIREKIVKKKDTKEELLRYLGKPAAGGAVFGLTAALIFVICISFFQPQMSGEHDNKETEMQPKETEAPSKDAMPQNEKELRQFVSQLLEEGSQENTTFYDSIQGTLETLHDSLVTVIAAKKDVDWFEVSYDSQYTQSGLLFKKTTEKFYILTGYKLVRGADSIQMELADGTRTTAMLEGYDTVYNLAVLSIDRERISSSMDQSLKTVTIGNTSLLSPGTPVFAVGDPDGTDGSVGIGFVSYINPQLALTDCVIEGIQSSIQLNGNGCSFLMGLNGELLGLFTNSDQNISAGYSQAYGINQLMVYVNRIFSEKTTAGIGITGQDIEASVRQENEIPEGVYIIDVKKDSASYQAGVQTGDVLAQLGGQEITSMSEYEELLMELTPDREVKMIVYRNSKGAYKKMELKITPTVRQG